MSEPTYTGDPHAVWDVVSFHLPNTHEGPELECIAMRHYHEQRPGNYRIAGAFYTGSDSRYHWFELHIDKSEVGL